MLATINQPIDGIAYMAPEQIGITIAILIGIAIGLCLWKFDD
jgi:tetrahydromethanopterin S-methyltransferase subunit G